MWNKTHVPPFLCDTRTPKTLVDGRVLSKPVYKKGVVKLYSESVNQNKPKFQSQTMYCMVRFWIL